MTTIKTTPSDQFTQIHTQNIDVKEPNPYLEKISKVAGNAFSNLSYIFSEVAKFSSIKDVIVLACCLERFSRLDFSPESSRQETE